MTFMTFEEWHFHHATGIEGQGSVVVPEILAFLLKHLDIQPVGNPDFFHEKFETLAIDDARRIKEVHAGKAFSGEKPRIFLIELYGITREAQNAMLKIIEEPLPGNHFFLVMPSLDMLLPTVRSRLYLVKATKEKDAGSDDSADLIAADFIKKSIKDRIAFVDDMAASISDEKMAKHEAIDFLNSLERHLHSKKSANGSAADALVPHIAAFEAIARARSYMNDRAPSVKMLLEYVALSIA